MQEMQVQSLGQEDPLEKEKATHSRSLAWRIPWTEEADRLHSMGLQESDMTYTLTIIPKEPISKYHHFGGYGFSTQIWGGA